MFTDDQVTSRRAILTSNTENRAVEDVNNYQPLIPEAQESYIDQSETADVNTGADMSTYENVKGNNVEEVNNTYEGMNYNPYTSLTLTGRQGPISPRPNNEMIAAEEPAYINYT